MVNLLRIINEPSQEITDNIFGGSREIRRKYCENLYELEKCLKKILELDNNKIEEIRNQ